MNSCIGTATRRKKSKSAKGELIFYSLLLILPLTQILVFYFGVNFQSILMVFQDYDTYNNEYIWDISVNIQKFLIDVKQQAFWIMVKNSFVVWLFTGLICTTLAVIFAYYIYKRRTGHNFFKFALFLPSVLPAILLVVTFKKFVGSALPAFYKFLFDKSVDSVFAYSSTARFWIVTVFSVAISFGGQVLVYTGAMDQISPEIIEAGEIDGAGTWREFVSIVLPSVFPTIGTFLITGVAGIFTNQNNLFNFFGQTAAPNEKTVGYYLYTMVYETGGKGGYCYAAFLGFVCTLVVLPIAFGVRKMVEKVQE